MMGLAANKKEQNYNGRVLSVEVQDRDILFDMDTKEDYRIITRLISQNR